ncbi:MAG: hypothetical protein WCU00_06325 [Candidatus Latescibacterota bacterium]
MKAHIKETNLSLFLKLFKKLSLCAGIVFLLYGCSGKAIKADFHEDEQLQQESEKIKHEVIILRARIDDIIRSQPGLNGEEIEILKKKGLRNPVEDIVNDLGGREDLMPFIGIFGARPSFYKDVRMYVLNSKWVYTVWDNGSAKAQQLFAYTVSDSGKITWKLIDTVKK